jgi:hypothetical protein
MVALVPSDTGSAGGLASGVACGWPTCGRGEACVQAPPSPLAEGGAEADPEAVEGLGGAEDARGLGGAPPALQAASSEAMSVPATASRAVCRPVS